MAVSFPHLSWWTWSGRLPRISQGPSLNPTLESDAFKFPLRAKMTSSSRRVKRKWHSREERKTGVEYDMVLVSSDDECFSGSESDGSDWSIGWLEPHGHEFQSDAETDNDNSFAVLVPCYRRNYNYVEEDLSRGTNFFCTSPTTHDCYPAGNKNKIERWLSSLQTADP